MANRRGFFRVALTAPVVLSGVARAASFPEKPVRMIVPAPPGSGPDALGRLLARKLGEAWGQPVVVENVLGAGGLIGHDRGAKAAPDGYTMLMGLNGPMSVSSSLNDRMPFDPVKDLAPVTLLMTGPNLLVINPRIPVGTLQELITYMRQNPGKLRYGHPGSGTSLHLAAELLNQMAGIRLEPVPYKSSSQMTVDVIAGHIDLIFHNVPVVLPHVRSGTLRALAITSLKRNPAAPEVPTIAEAGLPGYEITSWQAMYVPAATPRAIIDRINADLLRALGDAELRQWMTANAVVAGGGPPAELAAFQAAETSKWKSLIAAANIKPD
jgi:tripartite-type tricarboxylate transporter receptor subunit TctC